MYKTIWILMVTMILMGLAGCGVSRDDYDKTKGQLREAVAARDQSVEDLKRTRASMVELRSSMEQLRQDNASFQARIGELEGALAMNATLLEEARAPKVDLALTKKLESANRKMSELSSKIKGLASENKNLLGMNKKLQGSLAKMQTQISDYRIKLEHMIQVPASGEVKKNIPKAVEPQKSLPGGFGKDLFK